MKKLLILALFLPMTAMAQNSCYNFSRNLYFGFRGDDVVNLQNFLRTKGFFSTNSSGYFGFVTKNSVAKWQMSNGINAVGIFGMVSRKKFNDICGNNYVNPETIPVYNFVPSNSCQSWFDGCNECARNNPGDPAACTMRACFAAGKGYCKTFFDTNKICTTEYAPVCGQPREPACRYSVPACMIATPGPKTYSNRCEMNSAGGTFLYNGACTNGM